MSLLILLISFCLNETAHFLLIDSWSWTVLYWFSFYFCNFFKLSLSVLSLILCSHIFLFSVLLLSFTRFFFRKRGLRVVVVLLAGIATDLEALGGKPKPELRLPLEVAESWDLRIRDAALRVTPSPGITFLAFYLKMLCKLFLFIWCASRGIRGDVLIPSAVVVPKGDIPLSFRLLSLEETTIFLLAAGLIYPWSRICILSNLLKLNAVLFIFPLLFREPASGGDIDVGDWN